ncbi:DUF2797 domain-containing protein [Haladaptatus sp. YSMS36]|uniref:DUF2797 domain-containing protein n=1 Tax=Haladaptatus sp. YSMS36 TaxID=3033384 RepID=UPI0023E843C4|nr:DUF2797 domain-containing protein [Haladaptatus sp. YSMS36]
MQIVGYRTGQENEAALLVAEDGTVHREPLVPGHRLDYSLGRRHCAGVVHDDDHVACDEPRAPYCDLHSDLWPCAICTGNCDKPVDTCEEEHAIYLAAFAPDIFKVGVTRSWRLRQRLTEQGADRGAHIATVKDGRIARQREAEIANRLVDRVRVPTKIPGLHRTVDEAAWNALLTNFDVIEEFDFDYGFSLDAPPIAETLATGTVIGSQGRVLLLGHAGSTYAVDLRGLVGYELTAEASTKPVQSSLLAF